MMRLECARQAEQATAGGFTADAGVDYAVRVACLRQTLAQQSHPAAVDIEAVGGAEAVAEHQDGGWFSRRCGQAKQDAEDSQEPSKHVRRRRCQESEQADYQR